jgi:hypothetical protein
MIILFASLLLSATDPVVPQTAAPAQQPDQAAAPKLKAKKVCRKVESTSSRVTKRVCTTDPDYDRQQEGVDAADLRRMGAR